MGLIDQHRLVFVYASAGAGKTTAILQAAPAFSGQLVWLDVDTTDTATGRLLVYLEAALALQRAAGLRGWPARRSAPRSRMPRWPDCWPSRSASQPSSSSWTTSNGSPRRPTPST